MIVWRQWKAEYLGHKRSDSTKAPEKSGAFVVLENIVTIVLPENQESGKAFPFKVFGEL